MTECPDCGKHFKSAKCSCGYIPSSPLNKAEADRKWHELRRAARAAADVADERWKAKAAVLATVSEKGKRRWAYEVLALEAAGMYQSPHGLRIAKDAIKSWEVASD